jgi:sugar phosphate isomerase/epimerase
MLDFPKFTKENFPGVTHMDLFSGLFGEVTDDSMYVSVPLNVGAATRVTQEFDPSSASGKRWLEKMANTMKTTGTTCQHISNNAPRDICEPDVEKRKTGIAVAKKWLDGAAMLGAKSMRVNSGGPRIAPAAVATADYPKADELARYLANCIESFKEMADYGGKVGVKVTLENHWGLTANPMHIRIIVDEVKSPFCEASPDFCNWEQEYLMYNGLKALAPYAHTNVHAKYWNRWKDNDVKRSVKIMTDAGFQGTFALEYEDGPWDGVEGAKYLYKEVLAAL